MSLDLDVFFKEIYELVAGAGFENPKTTFGYLYETAR